MRIALGDQWRCVDGADIIAPLDAELPPNPTGKMSERGRDWIGHRAAWLDRHKGDVKYTICGYALNPGS